MNYTHNSVNHKDNYVDPVTGHHSNWVENLWSNLKIKLKSIRGSQGNMLDGHVDDICIGIIVKMKEICSIFC